MIQSTDPTEAKRALRHRCRVARRSMFEAAGADAAQSVADIFLSAVQLSAGQVVSAYWPMGDELDPRPLMQQLHHQGVTVALPVVIGAEEPLDFRRWVPETALESGRYGTVHPPASQPAVLPDVLLLPMLAADPAGWRLGYGGGYYDRTLAKLRAERTVKAIGLGFSVQMVDAVPHDGFDQRLDGVLTELGYVACKEGAA